MTGKSVTCIGACANEIMPKAKEGRYVRIVDEDTVGKAKWFKLYD